MSELLHTTPDWEKYWKEAGMPEFVQSDLLAAQTISVHFPNIYDREEFARKLGLKLSGETHSIWYPPREDRKWKRKEESQPVEPGRYPVYIVSKGRWDSRLTARALDLLGIPYQIVVEECEYEKYAAVIDTKNILRLPFSNLGKGSIPARNWIWEHSLSIGAKRHWILDDNIRSFYLVNRNRKEPITDFNPFVPVEKFTDFYRNVGMSGMNYKFFVPDRVKMPAFYLNTRVYSCILINNSFPERWRGIYNEDTDLSLRFLKAGWCTVLFNHISTNKIVTMHMKGGNTDTLYQGDGRLEMARSLKKQHPDLVTISRKWGRWQHHVDYSSFRNMRLVPAQ